MLVCDTTGTVHGGMLFFNPQQQAFNEGRGVWWQFGYEVGRGIVSGAYILYADKDGNLIRETTIKHLDQNKKPLPKSIIVWMTKEIK